MVRTQQGLTLFWAVSRTSKTRGGTPSGSWQKRVCFPLVDHSLFIPGNLLFVDPLHSLPDVHSCLQFAAPGEDVVAFIGPREARPSAGRSSGLQWISFTTFDRAHLFFTASQPAFYQTFIHLDAHHSSLWTLHM